MKTATVISGEATRSAPKCPTCGTAIALQATVEAFGQPAAWHFWGVAGERWIKCTGHHNGHDFTHFMTVVNGAYSHRLAWLERKPAVAEAQATLF